MARKKKSSQGAVSSIRSSLRIIHNRGNDQHQPCAARTVIPASYSKHLLNTNLLWLQPLRKHQDRTTRKNAHRRYVLLKDMYSPLPENQTHFYPKQKNP